MSKARTWSIRINLDELSSLFFQLHGDQERGEFMAAFIIGAHGGPLPLLDTNATRLGHAFGFEARQEAEVFRKRCQEAGKKGGNPSLNRQVNPDPRDLGFSDQPLGYPWG